MELTHRVATPEDLGMLEAAIDAAISELQQGFLSPKEIESSRAMPNGSISHSIRRSPLPRGIDRVNSEVTPFAPSDQRAGAVT